MDGIGNEKSWRVVGGSDSHLTELLKNRPELVQDVEDLNMRKSQG